MLLTVLRQLVTLEVKTRSPSARDVRTALANDVYHADHSMIPAVRRFFSLEVEGPFPPAGVMRAKYHC